MSGRGQLSQQGPLADSENGNVKKVGVVSARLRGICKATSGICHRGMTSIRIGGQGIAGEDTKMVNKDVS